MTILQRNKYAECPLCGSIMFAELRTDDCSQHNLYNMALPRMITWMKCDTCGHIFTDGHFDANWLQDVLTTSQPDQVASFDARWRYLSATLIDRIAHWVRDGQWLDVGFGNGALLRTAREYGYDTLGLDLRKENVRLMKNMGYRAANVSIEEFASVKNDGELFSVVSMCDVLEHMPYPRTALEATTKLLRKGGALLISCPNMDTAEWRYMDTKFTNPYWQELEHYHNFTRASLVALVQEYGFTQVSYSVSMRYKSGMELIFIKH